MDLDIPYEKLGGKARCRKGAFFDSAGSYCASLCYSSEVYGVAIVPHSRWRYAQDMELETWANNSLLRKEEDDRNAEHLQGFHNYACLPLPLGRVVEFGAGPWGQFRGVLAHLGVEAGSTTTRASRVRSVTWSSSVLGRGGNSEGCWHT